MTATVIAARLEELLVPLARHETLASAIEARLLRLVADTWSELVECCAAVLAGAPAAVLRAAAVWPPGTELLLPRLAAALGPATLLGLQMDGDLPDRSGLIGILLAHPSAQFREQVLDALQGDPDTTSLGGVCSNWARRMLIAVLGTVDGLSQQDRLALQERLLAHRRDAPGLHEASLSAVADDTGEAPGAGRSNDLGEALLAASHRRASQILAARAGVPASVVETAITRRDREGLLALCRAAGAGPEDAMALQIQLARVCPSQALASASAGSPAGSWRIEALRGRTTGLPD